MSRDSAFGSSIRFGHEHAFAVPGVAADAEIVVGLVAPLGAGPRAETAGPTEALGIAGAVDEAVADEADAHFYRLAGRIHTALS